jgi:hypothetical protein
MPVEHLSDLEAEKTTRHEISQSTERIEALCWMGAVWAVLVFIGFCVTQCGQTEKEGLRVLPAVIAACQTACGAAGVSEVTSPTAPRVHENVDPICSCRLPR